LRPRTVDSPMQLSLSTASADPLPASPRSSCDGLSPSHAGGVQNATVESDRKKPTDFSDLLPADAGKSKTVTAWSGSPRKKTPGVTPSPAAASVSPDSAAMLAFLAAPVPSNPAPVTTPVLAGGAAVDTGTEISADVSGGEQISSSSNPGVPLTAKATALSASLVSALPVPAPAIALPTALAAARPALAETAGIAAALPIPTQSAALTANPAEVAAAPKLAAVAGAAPLDAPALAPQPLMEAELASGLPELPGQRPAISTTWAARRLSAPSLPSADVATGANIAGLGAVSVASEKSPGKIAGRNFLNADKEDVTGSDDGLGIDVAKPSVTMAAVPLSHRQSAAAESATFSTAGVSQADGSARDPVNSLNDTASVAHRAVEAVMSAAERITGDRTAVNLQFSVAGNDLAVRVELRGGAVHTTFRTDSPELRAALAHEWSAAGSTVTDTSVRMSPPVFASSNAGNSTSFSGDGAQQQQQQSQRESAARPSAELFALNQARSGRADPSSGNAEPAATSRAVISTALHLQTFA
jgi:hypothetical protein